MVNVGSLMPSCLFAGTSFWKGFTDLERLAILSLVKSFHIICSFAAHYAESSYLHGMMFLMNKKLFIFNVYNLMNLVVHTNL